MRLRLALHHDGRIDLVLAPLDELLTYPDGCVGLLLAAERLDPADPLLGHKTTRRRGYDRALHAAIARGAFDVLYANRDGRLAEGARSNVFVRLDGRWYTPPLRDGLLPGVMRGVLLDDPGFDACERSLSIADLERAEAMLVSNALRGAVPARLAGRL